MILTKRDGVCFDGNQEMQMPAFGPDFSPNHDPHQARKLPYLVKLTLPQYSVLCTSRVIQRGIQELCFKKMHYI